MEELLPTAIDGLTSAIPGAAVVGAFAYSLKLILGANSVTGKQFADYRTRAEADFAALQQRFDKAMAKIDEMELELDSLRAEQLGWKVERTQLVAEHNEQGRRWATERAHLEARVAHLEEQLADQGDARG